jgi:Spermine/spermidine synthase domain
MTAAADRTGLLIQPVPLLARPPVRLFLTSATLLFVELLLIRWIPAMVLYVGFFRNFLLMASFLGIGVGILWGRQARRAPLSPFGPLLLAVTLLITQVQLSIQLRSPDEIFFGLAESKAADVNFIVLPCIVILATLIMATLAIPLGALLNSMPPLRAYATDIVGSMAGVAGFTVLSAAGTPPQVWFAVTAVLIGLMGLGVGITRWSGVTAACMATALIAVAVSASRPGQSWSPYYRIDTYSEGGVTALNVNGIPHQGLWPNGQIGGPFYEQVYRWFPGRTYDNVLIVGAGTGTDVAVSLERGARRVDAVEIDPRIQQIGIEQHPSHPYQDPRVTPHVDDGRAFLRNTTSKYDLVVFALPDSLTLVSTSANLRLESFLFTGEAFDQVRDHLNPNGVFVMYNFYRQDWLPQKIGAMLRDSFGSAPLFRAHGSGHAATMAAGPAVNALAGRSPPGDVNDPLDLSAPPGPATDDWPFLYLREPFIATYYIGAIALILLFAVLLVARAAALSGTSLRRFSPHFFVLGVAFLLLETRSLVTFSLLFGTTWLVNSLVFFAILASVLLAIVVNARFPMCNPLPFYVALFLSIGIALLLPPASLLIDPPWLRYSVAAVLTFAPVFFANLVFSYSFRDTKTADMAFASNLLGAMVGGAIEYLALLTGYQALLLVVALLYGFAWLLAGWRPVLADRDLVRVEAPRAPALPTEPA